MQNSDTNVPLPATSPLTPLTTPLRHCPGSTLSDQHCTPNPNSSVANDAFTSDLGFITPGSASSSSTSASPTTLEVQLIRGGSTNSGKGKEKAIEHDDLLIRSVRRISRLHPVKPTCVGLLGSSGLAPATVPVCLGHLDDLITTLHSNGSELPQLPPSLVSYIFFPISEILRRNSPQAIPDQIFEKVFIVLASLLEGWWWHCEVAIWEQIFMLCGSVLGGLANKGKGKERDDEVKQAAAQCLYALLREREVGSPSTIKVKQAKARLLEFQTHARSPYFKPILGQTISATISISELCSLPLQNISLKVLQTLLELYTSDEVFPMIIPGVVSSMSKITLGFKLEKQWAHGESVAAALHVMRLTIVRAICDDICEAEGVLPCAGDLESLIELVTPSFIESSEQQMSSPSITKRTPSWLKGTTSQLHIAINNLSFLMGHPSPAALRALVTFSRDVLEATPRTLPQTQPLLLSFLLSTSNSSFDSISSEAQSHLRFLLSSASRAHINLLQTLMRLMGEHLSALPRLVSIREESKVRHLVGLIESICKLASPAEESDAACSSISEGIGKLLGPSGGIEKWGWSLLTVLEFSEVPLTAVRTSAEHLMLEADPDSLSFAAFPSLQLKSLSANTSQAVEHMLRALGAAAGETCLYCVEWFLSVGKRGIDRNAVAAMWCACRLLEGVSGIDLSAENSIKHLKPQAAKRLEKLARSLTRILPELWDQDTEDIDQAFPTTEAVQDLTDPSLIENKKGVHPLHENLKIIRSSPAILNEITNQPVNHRALALQIISVCIGVLQSRSSSLFIHILYPVLHSLVSQVPFLASTAYASLQFITIVTSYASPANLLLSNFDYALDAISRRLTRRWLDVDATQVLGLLVRLVGSNVVEKAGDVVEECFDRLDDFHGYDILVEGLVNVLVEVTRVLKDDACLELKPEKESSYTFYPRFQGFSDFLEWYRARKKTSTDAGNKEDYESAPRRAWGKSKQESDENNGEEKEREATAKSVNSNDEPQPTPTQMLTRQIVSRSLYFLTHGSPVIRARILALLTSSVPNLSSSALMPAIHSAWPFVLNRLGDRETFVVSAAASLIEVLSTYMGDFMFRRIWDDVWPKFKALLSRLEVVEMDSALVHRRGYTSGPESAYTHSHRLYRALLNTMAVALQDVRPHERSFWDAIVLFRRFLDKGAHPELQQSAKRLYNAAMSQNGDAVWLVLTATYTRDHPVMAFLYNKKWDIADNARSILSK